MCRKCLLEPTEGTIDGRIVVTQRRGKRCNQLLDKVKKMKGYWKLKQEALNHTLWRTCTGKGYGPVIWNNDHLQTKQGISSHLLQWKQN